MVSNGWVHEIGFTVSVEVVDTDGPRDVGSEVCGLRRAERSLRRCGLVGHVFEVTFHHGNGVDISRTTDVCDSEVIREWDAELDNCRCG